MYQQIWKDYLEKGKGESLKRTLYLGQALRFIREENRISRNAVAEKAKIGISLLKAMETKKEVYSTWNNIEHLAEALNIPVETLLQRSREEFPSNFFVQKKEARPRFDYDGVTVYPYSPPLNSQSDFLLLKTHLYPGKVIADCQHPQASEIACYVLEGPLKFRFGNQAYEFRANQSFFFDGSVEHEFINESKEKTAEFFLCLSPPPTIQNSSHSRSSPRREEGALDLAYALEYVRRKASPVSTIPLPWNILAAMTGISVRALMHLGSGKTEIVYWDKLEALAQGAGISLEEIIDVARGKSQGRFEICTALHRGYLNYEDQFGLKIYSAVRPGVARRKFFMGQVFLNKRGMLPSLRRRWRYKTHAFLCVVVQDGRILVEYGNRKKEQLTPGDSVYLDANLEFTIHNLEHQETKLFLFTHPPLF